MSAAIKNRIRPCHPIMLKRVWVKLLTPQIHKTYIYRDNAEFVTMATPFLTHGLIGYELQKRWHCVSACLVRESSLAVVLAVGSQQVSFSVKALAFGAICGSD